MKSHGKHAVMSSTLYISADSHRNVSGVITSISSGGGIPTDSPITNHTSLTDEQIKQLAVIIVDEFGSDLDWKQFNDTALLLFEDVPGFELMTHSKIGSYRNRPVFAALPSGCRG